ncbi:RNA polymerase II C-terminal domain phosphatase-like 4 [Nicotiana tabacum]|uniref:RNA polymerase II C-terminal domain phosphatase-like 4 n=1 Tax=Nicotiana tabacum TaxID=4097 RepID=A0AC58T5L1_TOBAC
MGAPNIFKVEVYIGRVLETLVQFGAPKKILVDGKPHLGTDKLVPLLQNFRRYLEELGVTSRGEPAETSGASLALDICSHPGVIGGMCIRCGQKVENESGVALGYIHKNLRLADDEIARLGDKDLKNLLRHKKLYLVLDLDHTLLNSARLADISAEELYLKDQREVLPGMLLLLVMC